MPQYRLIEKTYITGTEPEDGPGSLTNVVQRDGGSQRLWSGTLESQPDNQWFADAGVKIEYEDEFDESTWYRLEIFKDGEWRYCDSIQPVEPSESSNPHQEDLEDFEDEDSVPDHEQADHDAYWRAYADELYPEHAPHK